MLIVPASEAVDKRKFFAPKSLPTGRQALKGTLVSYNK
jgi:hypothetical protein